MYWTEIAALVVTDSPRKMFDELTAANWFAECLTPLCFERLNRTARSLKGRRTRARCTRGTDRAPRA
jgi:hypothetical protein